MPPIRSTVWVSVAVVLGWTAVSANAETKPAAGKAEAGRSFALLACTGCHIVAPDQPFKPVYTGSPHPPDFNEIANRSSLTAARLRHHLETLPTVPQSGMPNMMLSDQQLQDVVAFIFGLRDKPAAPSQ
jgi:mono/diheme cytochrome c family protein